MNDLEKMAKKIERLEKMAYPYYGIDKALDQVVLFTGPQTGVNMNGKGWPVGYRSESWAEESFVPFYGRR